MSRLIMQQALDALDIAQSLLEKSRHHDQILNAYKSLRDELAKPEERVCCGDYEKCWKACTPRGRWLAEKELAKPEQEPVAYRKEAHGMWFYIENKPSPPNDGYEPLYTSPPRKEWVSLKDEEEIELGEKYGDDFNAYINARDAKLKELNT